MSNIQQSINFLKDNPDKHFITIINQDNGSQVGPAKIFLNAIANEDLKSFIKYQIGSILKPTMVWVELRKVNGSSSAKVNSFGIEVTRIITNQRHRHQRQLKLSLRLYFKILMYLELRCNNLD